MDYGKLKKLDEESLQQMIEWKGPSDKCICNLLYTPEEGKKNFRSSLKRAFTSLARIRSNKKDFGQEVVVPRNFSKGKVGLHSTKETVKRTGGCGKCGCDKENIVVKHSTANIRIISPDISSICPCPEDCLPDKDKFTNNIKLTVEHVRLVTQGEGELETRRTASEPQMERRSFLSMDDEKYDEYEYESSREDSDDN